MAHLTVAAAYGTACENPAYAEWMRGGVSLVRRLPAELSRFEGLVLAFSAAFHTS
jgi:hypothetical protein